MRKLKSVFITLACIWSTEVRTQTTTCSYDSVSGNYVISFVQDSSEHLIFWPRTKIDPLVRALVSNTNDTITYSYQVTNGKTSRLHLSDFYLPNNPTIFDIEKPDSDWHFGYSNKTNGLRWSNTKPIHYAPQGEDYYEIGMPPNSVVTGFRYRSTRLPGVVDCYFQGFAFSGSDHELPGDVTKILFELEGFPRNYVKRTTIGPQYSPIVFAASPFLDTLISYKHQALALKWIDNEGVASSLDQKLENARQQLSKGNTKAARNMLEAFVNEIEAQNGKHLTSEAYALLKFNAEYLIDHLPGAGKPDKK